VDHPEVVIFLNYDPFGIFLRIQLDQNDQAMYYLPYWISAKLQGQSRGITEPVATFSAFLESFSCHVHPQLMAKLLGEKIDKHGVNVYLVNTGLKWKRVRGMSTKGD